MTKPNLRPLLLMGGALALFLSVATAILALLSHWVPAAITGTALATIACAASLLLVRDVRALLRESTRVYADHKRIFKVLARMRVDQKGRNEALRSEFMSQLSLVRDDTQAIETDLAALAKRLEIAERRSIGALEASRLESADSVKHAVTDLELAIDNVRQDVINARKDVTAHVTKRGMSTVSALTTVARDETRQTEALLQLMPLIAPIAPLPPSGRWAMDARALLHLSYICRQLQPKNILELGGGTSTVWLGYLLQGTGASITSIDHDEKFARLTAESLERHGLTGHARIKVAPLTTVNLGVEAYNWYDPSTFYDMTDIDLLIVDGPPASAGSLARYPALPLLHDRLTFNCAVVLDDSERVDEKGALDRWLDQYGEFERVADGISRLAVLRRAR